MAWMRLVLCNLSLRPFLAPVLLLLKSLFLRPLVIFHRLWEIFSRTSPATISMLSLNIFTICSMTHTTLHGDCLPAGQPIIWISASCLCFASGTFTQDENFISAIEDNCPLFPWRQDATFTPFSCCSGLAPFQVLLDRAHAFCP